MVMRHAEGKVTLGFPKGLRESEREGVLAAIDKLLQDLVKPRFPKETPITP